MDSDFHRFFPPPLRFFQVRPCYLNLLSKTHTIMHSPSNSSPTLSGFVVCDTFIKCIFAIIGIFLSTPRLVLAGTWYPCNASAWGRLRKLKSLRRIVSSVKLGVPGPAFHLGQGEQLIFLWETCPQGQSAPGVSLARCGNSKHEH